MTDNNQQVKEPVLDERALNAQKEFKVIVDVLLVPLRTDISNQKLPPRRRWRGGCLLELLPELLPDLVPVPVEESGEFCNDEAKLVLVKVENRGNVDAPECVTEVRFRGIEEPKLLDTPVIPARDARVLDPLEIPDPCFVQGGQSGFCEFTITVDVNNQVDELDKANNTVSGGCTREG